jgi:dCTP deaminase
MSKDPATTMSVANLALFPELLSEEIEPGNTGLLPCQRIEELVRAGHIASRTALATDQIQPASIDLRLGSKAYRVRASFLPNLNSTVQRKLQDLEAEEIDISHSTLLQKGSVYIVPVQEELSLPDEISARANPKSSTGRLDVFTRLITDYGNAFDEVRAGYKGRLFAEIAPITFSIYASEGSRLNQLRFRRGNPFLWDKRVIDLHRREPIVFSQDGSPAAALVDEGLRLSVDLQGIDGAEIVGYRARKDAPPIDLAKVNYYDPQVYWEPLYRDNSRSLILMPGEFYILTSKEKVSVPPDRAAEMSPFDASDGEFRIHYAGFFDPGFGWSPGDQPKGSHAVLEVRVHGVPSLLEDGQLVCRLVYEPMMAPPSKLYGADIGSSYQSQKLRLGKHFKS